MPARRLSRAIVGCALAAGAASVAAQEVRWQGHLDQRPVESPVALAW